MQSFFIIVSQYWEQSAAKHADGTCLVTFPCHSLCLAKLYTCADWSENELQPQILVCESSAFLFSNGN